MYIDFSPFCVTVLKSAGFVASVGTNLSFTGAVTEVATELPLELPLGQVSGITVFVSDHVQLQSIVQVAYVMRP